MKCDGSKRVFVPSLQKFINDWLASQSRDLKVCVCVGGGVYVCVHVHVPQPECLLSLQVMKDKMGNHEAERKAAFFDQPWCHEAVPRYFYAKVRLL